MNYPLWLVSISVFVALLEWGWPAREQKRLRKRLWSDCLYLIFNGHFLGVFLYGIATYYIIPYIDSALSTLGVREQIYFGAVQSWGLIFQVVVALFVIDLIQWLVHNALHRIPFLWPIHQVHHSVQDGEMDWIVAFRFSWLEVVIYKSMMFIPLMWFGFAPEVVFVHAVLGTLIGHLNHANLTWDYGPLRYLLNSPRMHLYHHDFYAPSPGQNFGILFSCWDWVFGTAHLPQNPPKKIGFPGVNAFPKDFFSQVVWPLPLCFQGLLSNPLLMRGLGIMVLFALYGLSL